jgi:hypothetical protein
MTRGSNPAGAGRDVSGEKHGSKLKDKAVHQVTQFLYIFLYLFVLLGLFAIDRSIVLEQHNLHFTDYGFALINALVLAKVILVAEDLHLGRNFEDGPLLYPILLKSLLFALVLMGFHILESTVEGLWHGKTVLESVSGIGGGGIKGILSVGIIMFITLIPFFAFREISRVLGPTALRALLLDRGSKRVIIEAAPKSPDRS